ncbi:hypothetical protein MNBD_NITROSPINAE02-1064 [hydrothermal vent metagenome]|uniref:Peptidase A2 domain-containing protein n=1 Tax=hydrothermal vent metagenome TaxID=652676 RepID=A0A3B1C134_9ZZZZ
MKLSSLAFSLAVIAVLSSSASARSSFVYRWEGDNQAIHITNSLEGVPEKYRAGATRMRKVTIKSIDHAPQLGPAHVDEFEEISFDKSKPGVIVSAVVDQKVGRKAIIDTGSDWVVITTKFARALGLDIPKLRKGRFRVFGGRINAPVARLQSLRVGPAMAKNVHAAIIDFEGRGEVSAIIGMNFLARFVFEIDQSRGTLTFLSVQ